MHVLNIVKNCNIMLNDRLYIFIKLIDSKVNAMNNLSIVSAMKTIEDKATRVF